MSSVVRFTTRHAALLPLLLSPLAGAQESPAAPVTLDRITVSGEEAPAYTVRETGAATRLDLAPRETPQSLSIVTRQQLDDQNLQSLRDVLDQTSGIYSYAYDSERVVFSSRGFIIDNLMYDGLPAASNFATESLDDNLDTALYERIEIVRGANGLMMGAGNPSAAVNLVRKRADQRSFTGDLNLSYGSWDNARASADFATRLNASGSIRARAIGVYQHRESYQDLYQKEKGVLYGVIDADLSPHTLLTLGYDLQNTMPQANTWGSFPLFFSDGSLSNWPRSVTTATRWSFWDKRKQSFFGELRHDFDNGWQARAALNRRSFKEDLALFYVYGFPDPQTGEGLVPFAYREKVKTTQNAADAYARGPFQWFGRRHELVLGASASKLYIKGNEYQHGALAEVGNFFDWDGRYPQPEFSSTPTPDSDIEVRQTGLYAAARLSLADPLKLILGARRSGFKNDYYYLYSGAPFAQQRNKLVPYAGALYELNASYSAFVSYTAIFNPQNKREYDGTYLQPLQGKSYETGIKGEHFGGRFNTALTLFETRLDHVAENALDASGNQLYVLDDGRTPAASSVDGTRTRGFEAQANGTLRENWNLSLGFSRYILQGPDHGEIRTYIPRTLIRGFSSWTPALAQRQLTVGAGANWQSSSHVTVGAPSGAVDMQQSPVTLLSLMARWQFTPQLSVQLNGDNLLDQTYYVLDEYGNLYYGTPLNATATLRYRF